MSTPFHIGLDHKSVIQAPLIIPAFGHNGQAFKAHLTIEVTPSDRLLITCMGNVGASLEKLFTRAVLLIASLKEVWQPLKSCHYQLVSLDRCFRVRDVRSAGLPICLALLNIFRAMQGQPQIYSLVGTGVLRADGSFEAAAFEDVKQNIINQIYANEKTFISAQTCQHVFELDALLNCY